jgi:predicted ATPase
MTTNEREFGYKIRAALNENIDGLPAQSIQRLASARKLALSRKKTPSGSALFQARLATHMGHFLSDPFSWLARIGVTIPVIVLVVGLIGIYEAEEARRISEIAEMDAAVLADELPLSAYTDDGFNAFLAEREK